MGQAEGGGAPSILLVALGFWAVALAGCVAPQGPGTIGSGAAPTYAVHLENLAFEPATLQVAVGARVVWHNDDPVEHTVTPTDTSLWGTEGSGSDPSDWIPPEGSWSFVFREEGTFAYYCIPHASQGADGAWRGMVGTIVVTADAALPGPDGSAGDATPPPARTVDVAEIGRDASDVPPALPAGGAAHRTFTIRSTEVVATMADGVTYTYWTFNGTVPGPMLRARVGDTVTVEFTNDASSTMPHNIDFHAVTGPGGGAAALTAEPRETRTLTFKALNPGLYIYHCAVAGSVPAHIGHGMYGLILIEPQGGLPPVDREFYVVQGDFYSAYAGSAKGHHEYDADAAAREEPSFVVVNGRVGSLTGARAMQAEVGDTVRIWFGVGGPNLVSSFHVIGEIFDAVYREGDLVSPPARSVQTTLVPAGGAVAVEFTLEVPGDYLLVDHSINRVAKGAVGILHVAGEDDPEVFAPGEPASGGPEGH